MRYLYPNKISAVWASEEATGYPVENILDTHAEHPWRATSKDAQLKLTVGGRGDSVGLASTNAVGATVTVKDATETTTLFGPTFYDLTGIADWYQFFTDTGIQQTELMVAYGEQEAGHIIIFDLTAATGDLLEVGVARAGIVRSVDEPGWGFEEYLVDYPIAKKKLASGGDFYIKGTVVSGFRLEVFGHRTDTFWAIMRGLAKQIGEESIFWQVTTLDNPNWTIFGHFNGMPGGPHTTLEYSLLKMDLIQSV